MVDLSFLSRTKWSPAYPVSLQLAKVEVSDYAISTGHDDQIQSIGTYMGHALTQILAAGHPTTLFIDDRNSLLISGGSNGIDVFDMRSGRLVQHVELPVEKFWGVDAQGDLVASSETYTGFAGPGPFNHIVELLRSTANTVGLYQHRESAISTIRINTHRS